MSRWHLNTSVLMGSAVWVLGCTEPIAAQVVPDNTLPTAEQTQVSGNPNFQIDGGARRGGNLFHSFKQFSIPTGGSAFFNNAADVQNIFSRVTGGSISNIDGLIRANATANLFLLNPNGILFGAGARLNIGGSFIASTANSINFTDGFQFNATNPQAAPLLTISVPIGLQYGSNPGRLQVQRSNLQVNPGRTLALLGGNVNLEGGQLLNPGGQVELVGVAGTDTLGLNGDGANLSLSVPESVALADISLTNGSLVDTRATGGGSIAISARNLNLSEGSQLLAGISGVGLPNTQAGNIEINATGTVTVTGDGSKIANEVELGAVGNAGNVNITAESLFVTNGAQLLASTRSQGNAGNFNITTGSLDFKNESLLVANAKEEGNEGNAGNITINVRDAATFDYGVRVYTDVTGKGRGGDINITAGSLALTNGSHMLASTAGQGNAGNFTITTGSLLVNNESFFAASANGRGNAGSITINAGGPVSIEYGAKLYTDVNAPYLSNVAKQPVKGNGGDINITAGSLVVRYGGQLVANSYGDGNAGNISITTGSLSVTNEAFLTASANGRGNGGDITINASGPVSFIDGSSAFSNLGFCQTNSIGCSTSTDTVTGNGGNITINASSLNLINGSFLATGVGDNFLNRKAQGSAGNISIQLRDALSLDQSYITSRVFANGIGKAGNIDIRAGSVSSSQSLISASTQGQGDAGGISVLATDSIVLDDSDISTAVQKGAIGNARGINITARSLTLTNGAQLNAVTSGEGNAGDILINASNSVSVSGTNTTAPPIKLFNYTPPRFTSPPEFVDGVSSGIFTSTNSSGVGGKIEVNTSAFSVSNSAVIDSRTTANGPGGAIFINTNTFEAISGGQLTAITSGNGTAGNITLRATDTVKIAGSDPSYSARLAQFGSEVDIYSKPRVESIGAAAGLFANTEPSSAGRGGNIQITAGQLTVQEGARLVTSTSGSGRAGYVTLNAPDIQLSGAASGLFAQTTTSADAGNLTIQPQGNGQRVRVNLQDGAQISASTSGSGRGGQLTITAPNSITLTGDGSIIAAGTGGSGAGGNLTLTTDTLNIQNQAEVTVSSSGTGSAGSLFVNANQIYLDNQGRIRADTTGGGGDIILRSPLILLRNGSNITTNAKGSNIPGGNIAIDTRFLVAGKNEDSNISANSEDFRGGNVSINAYSIFGIQPSPQLTPLSDITATGATSALSGTLDVTTAGIDPSSGLVELPTDFADLSRLIATRCPANEGNSFVITGRGGLPPTPEQELDDDAEWQDRRRLTVGQHTPQMPTPQTPTTRTPNPKSYTPIIEATGWQRTPTGEIILVATTPDPTVQHPLKQPVNCKSRQ
ncbi:two-partner secretion domain-containing protein [Scytonema sp. PRP1]|uniref:two-partner secretion domain-containing protein n=1 Tax=Scytonema sp. PRP1 TaxID=3120513 RepID=UPI00300C405E